jgi:hypothetical protein
LKAYTLRVYLVSGPFGRKREGQEIFRALKIRGDQTLEDLHYAVLCSFEREQEGGGYEFFFDRDSCGPEYVKYRCTEGEEKPDPEAHETGRPPLSGFATLDSLQLDKDRVFHYRLGAKFPWLHLIHVVSVGPVKLSEEYPLLIEKAGSLPSPSSGQDPVDGGSCTVDPPRGYRREIFSLLLDESHPFHRRQWENVALRPNCRLKTAVSSLPSHWLDGMCMLLGMKKAGHRRLCIEKLQEKLPQEENLRRIWSNLPVSSRKILAWILQEKGGWATIRQFSYRFGQEAEIGWWWNEEQIPATPLGMLQLCGLVYVGKNPAGNRKVKIATVPVELRKPLKQIVQTPDAQKQALSLWNLFLQGAALPPPTPAATRKILASRIPLKGRWKELGQLDILGFLKDCPLEKETERFYTYMLGRIRREPDGFPRKEVRTFLKEMIRGSSVWNRLAAYKLGVVLFGKRFAQPAKKDNSTRIRQWAEDLFDPKQEELF